MEESQQPPDDLKNTYRWSIGLSILVALMFITNMIISYFTYAIELAVLSTFLSIVIPICGIVGYNNKEKGLWNIFTSCSICEVVLSIFYIIKWTIKASEKEHIIRRCEEGDISDRDICDFYLNKNFDVYLYVSISLFIIIIFVSLISIIKGKSLFNHPYFNNTYINRLSNQGGIEMINFITTDGVLMSGIPLAQIQQLQQQPQHQQQQLYNIVQGIPVDLTPPNTNTINMNQPSPLPQNQPQPQQAKGSYVVNIDQPTQQQPLMPEIYNSTQSSSYKVLLPPSSSN